MSAVSAIPDEDRVELAFAAYGEAAKRAQASLDVADGIAAGRAWATFLSLFTGRDVIDIASRSEMTTGAAPP